MRALCPRTAPAAEKSALRDERVPAADLTDDRAGAPIAAMQKSAPFVVTLAASACFGTTYSTRMKTEDGHCYVDKMGNPPMILRVSCTAPIEPPPDGSDWCQVESADNPDQKVSVDCGK
jgi:hypothetical protein